MEYILSDKSGDCIFCDLPEGLYDKARLMVCRSTHSFLVVNRFPYNNGHVMIVPDRHVSNLEDLPAEEYHDVMDLLRDAVVRMKGHYHPDGMNVGINLGQMAGAGVEEHVHVHIVPRWGGDTNFMPVLADCRVMPQHLDETWEILRGLWPDGKGGNLSQISS